MITRSSVNTLTSEVERNTSVLFPLVLEILEEVEVADNVDNVHDKEEQGPHWHHTHFRTWKMGEWIQTRLVQNQAQTVWARFAFGDFRNGAVILSQNDYYPFVHESRRQCLRG